MRSPPEGLWDAHLRLHDGLERLRDAQGRSPALPATPADFERFAGWLRASGFPAADLDRNVEIRADVGAEGAGLVARRALAAGERFVTVPGHLVLGTRLAREDVLREAIETGSPLDRDERLLLATLLLALRHQDDARWMPYLRTLPRRFDSALHWSPDEIAALGASPVRAEMIRSIALAALRWAWLAGRLEGSLGAPVRYDDLVWALSIVSSRQNRLPRGPRGEPELALIPVIDLCNHEPGAVLTTRYDRQTGAATCHAARAFAPGEMLSISYGPRSNARLLLSSGFVVPTGPHPDLEPFERAGRPVPGSSGYRAWCAAVVRLEEGHPPPPAGPAPGHRG